MPSVDSLRANVRAPAVATAFVCIAMLSTNSVFAAPASGAPYKVAAILSLSGPFAPLGEPERDGIQMAQQALNASGGIGGRPIDITVYDDEGKADIASQLATQALGNGVVAILGGSVTSPSQAIARASEPTKTVQFYFTPFDTLWNTPTGVTSNVFELSVSSKSEIERLMGYATNVLHSKRLAILADETPFGKNGAALLAAAADKAAVTVVVSDTFSPAATDLTPQLVKVRSAGADTMFVWTGSAAAAIAARQAHQLGVKAHFMGPGGMMSDNFLKVAGADGNGVFADTQLNYTHPSAELRRFLSDYRSSHHARPTNAAAVAYDAVFVLAKGLQQSKGNGGDQLSKALETMPPYDGPSGPHKFSSTNHCSTGVSAMDMAYDRNGVWFVLPSNTALPAP